MRALAAFLALAVFPAAATVADGVSGVEADWLTQVTAGRAANATRAPAVPAPAATAPTATTTKEDAAGGVNGVKDGKWGFHTNSEDKPWWQVDLGESVEIGRVVIYNRCGDPQAMSRAAHVMVLVSADGKGWRKVYQHDGKVFGGVTEGKPLTVTLAPAAPGQDEVAARFVRLQLPGRDYLHLDEVEVYGLKDAKRNLALNRPADQSSVSQWSNGAAKPEASQSRVVPTRTPPTVTAYPLADVLDRGRRLGQKLRAKGVDVAAGIAELDAVEKVAAAAPAGDANAVRDQRQAMYFRARATVRKMLFSDPLLNFDSILFAKRAAGQFTHMSDQYYGWWSRGGGGICIIENWKGDSPRVRCITDGLLPPGSFLRPDLSYDGKRVVFAYARHYPHVAGLADKLNKANVPEDAFYHLYEVGIDGKGLRRLTRGKYDNFDARYLPGGGIVFCSTRRGQFIQCGSESAKATLASPALPDVYVRCGGDARRPVPVYTLHTMELPDGPLDPNTAAMKAISAFEMFEWTPAVANDGRILYARWDYVDRHNMPFMKLWSTNPDGTSAQIVWGNYVRSPHCAFEARSVPGSNKIVFTGSAHHSVAGGPLYLLDPDVNPDTAAAAVKLTPEVCDPETGGWPRTYYTSPWPLSEDLLLTAWSPVPLQSGGGNGGWGTIANPANAQGLYVFDTLGNLELIHRDPNISSECLMPLRPRPLPPVRSQRPQAAAEGSMVLQNVYHGLAGVPAGTVKRLRLVAIPAKTQPWMNNPNMGATHDDPGKCVLGTVPVEADGSAHFVLPAGVNVFFQALDGRGAAVQTMRSATYVQPGQTLSCVGCHESREVAPTGRAEPLALRREPSKITPGPDGSWPLRFETLVQPALDKHCVRCHRAGAEGNPEAVAKLNLTAATSYRALSGYAKGGVSLHAYVSGRYGASFSPPGEGPALATAVGKVVLSAQPRHPALKLDADSLDRLLTWMDTYAQQRGSFSDAQEAELRRLRGAWKALLAERERLAP